MTLPPGSFFLKRVQFPVRADPGNGFRQQRFPRKTAGSPHGAFPDFKDPPSLGKQGLAVSVIPVPVAGDFVTPELRPGSRQPEQMTVMAMPETAVNQNDSLPAGQNDIGSSWQLSVMKAVAESFCMQGFTEQDLGFRILAPDPGHHAAADSRRDNVSQWELPRWLMKAPSCAQDLQGSA